MNNLRREAINNEVMTYMNKFSQAASRHVNSKYENDEVVSMTVEYFLRAEDSKIVDMYNNDGIEGCVRYICRGVVTQATSVRSNYYYKTKHDNSKYITDLSSYRDEEGNRCNPLENLAVEEPEANSTGGLLDELDDILENDIDSQLAMIFRMNKLESISIKKIHEKTGIPVKVVFDSIHEAMSEIKLAVADREKKRNQLDDYGVISQEEYNSKYASI